MEVYSLDGRWDLKQAGKKDRVTASVPGNVHTDLLAAGVIPDPYYRDNEDRFQWIGEADWMYSRDFVLPAEFVSKKKLVLRCEGLDTLAVIRINSKEVARTDNMFRTWEFDVTGLMKQGKNHIEIRFDSTLPYIKEKQGKQ